MKKVILMFMLVGLAMNGVCKDYEAPKSNHIKTVYTDTVTSDRYLIKNVAYSVYKGRNGAFYIWKNGHKTYLPIEVQISMGRIYKEKKNEK